MPGKTKKKKQSPARRHKSERRARVKANTPAAVVPLAAGELPAYLKAEHLEEPNSSVRKLMQWTAMDQRLRERPLAAVAQAEVLDIFLQYLIKDLRSTDDRKRAAAMRNYVQLLKVQRAMMADELKLLGNVVEGHSVEKIAEMQAQLEVGGAAVTIDHMAAFMGVVVKNMPKGQIPSDTEQP